MVHLGRIIAWNQRGRTKLWTHLEQGQTGIPLKGDIWSFDQLPLILKSHSTTLLTISLSTRDFPFSQYWVTRRSLLDLSNQITRHFFLQPETERRNQWPSIQALMSETGHFQLPFWNALRIHNFLQSLANPAKFNRTLTTFEDYCIDEGALPQALSKIYTLLNSHTEQLDLSFLQKWETDLQHCFTDAQKQNTIRFSLETSICMKIQESNYKILTRWYYTNTSRLPLITVGRCQVDKGTLPHIFWSCPLLTHVWITVQTVTQKFMEHPNPDDPAFLLLHATTISAKRYQESIMRHLPIAAKSRIPLLWKKVSRRPLVLGCAE